MSLESRPDFLARQVAIVVAWVSHHPWKVLAAAGLITLAAILAAYQRLEYHTQRNDLLSPNKPCQQRWQRYLDLFGDDDDMIVVVEGRHRDQMVAAVEAVAKRVNDHPAVFDRVFYRVDLRHLQDRSLLYLPVAQLEAIRTQIECMEPLLGPFGSVSWRMLSIQSLLGNAVRVVEAQRNGMSSTPAERDLLAQLPSILSSASDTLNDPSKYRNPWQLTTALGINSPATRPNELAAPQYLFTEDGSLALLMCRPKKNSQSFTPAKQANAVMRGILAEVGQEYPEVQLGLTGIPVLETDEMELSDTDSVRAAWLALFGVAVLYFLVYRGCRYPLLTISTLVIGTIWALGWATITVGHLNILSATFAVMLIGMGDYGVLWVTRFDEARGCGESLHCALRSTAMSVGPSILTAAATTGLAFFAIMLADFKAVAELGWIAGWGVFFCAISCIVLMPALLVILEQQQIGDRRRLPSAEGSNRTIINVPRLWLPALSSRPRLVLIGGGVLLVVCGVTSTHLKYDHNLLNLQSPGLDSVQWEHKLITKAAGVTWDALSIAHSRQQVLDLKAKYEALPEVSRVVEVATLIPEQQDSKLPIVQAIHQQLSQFSTDHSTPAPVASLSHTTRQLAIKLAELADDDTLLSAAAKRLATTIDSTSDVSERLRVFDLQMVADLARELTHLKSVSHPARITETDIPRELGERYIGSNGEFLVRAFARDSLWDYEALARFTTAVTTVDPEATGKAFRTLEGLRQMKSGFEWAAAYALVAIVVVLFLDFQRFGDLLLALLPLGVGVTLTLGLMAAMNVSLNPANMIALPLIVGVGVDNGVHVLHDYRTRRLETRYRLGFSTGRGVLVAALTTIIGFVALMTARHQGMASLGLALTIGVTSCMVAALVLLPAVLQLKTVQAEVGKQPSCNPERPIVVAKAA
jgi:hopanoid biosynthesis associated RND transporter like protein HpnN